MIHIFTATTAISDVDSLIGHLIIGIGIALMVATSAALVIHTIFMGYQKSNMVIHPKALFYKRLGILGAYIISVLCALGKILVFGV